MFSLGVGVLRRVFLFIPIFVLLYLSFLSDMSLIPFSFYLTLEVVHFVDLYQ